MPTNIPAQCSGTTVLNITNGTTDTWVNNTGNTVTVKITAIGAGGGNGDVLVNNNPGGSGATIVGEFIVLNGESIRATAGAAGFSSNGAAGGGGGGGSGAVNCGTVPNCSTGSILLIASGGGGGGLGTLASDIGIGGLGTAVSCGDAGTGGTGNSGAGGGGKDANGADGIAGFVIATGGLQVDQTGLSNGGSGAGDVGGVLAGDGGPGMGGGGGGGLSEGAGGAGHKGGNAGGLVVGESGGTGGASCNTGANQTNTSGSNGGGANVGSVIIECLAVLPVEFVDFEARLIDDHIVLEWTTASEINNRGFYLQHSTKLETWIDIDFIEGKGTLETFQQYKYVHRQPMSGTNYYRLMQVDTDGSIAYSPVIAASIKSNTISAIFYPNPANFGNLNLKISGAEEAEALVIIYDVNGRSVFNQTLAIQDQGASTYSLAIDHLPSGIYTAMILMGRNKIMEKILITQG